MALNLENIERALRETRPDGVLLDLGCDDGRLTMRFAAAARAREVHGVEVGPNAAEAARARGVDVAEADLNDRLPFPDRTFDTVVSNQVIEHLVDTDSFVHEIKRLLKPGGIAVTSTENLSSWHNVAALVFGWQPFSLSNVSSLRSGLGNPLAIHRASEPDPRRSWQHQRVFSYRGLGELFEAHGLRVRARKGAGYHPLPGKLGRIDPRHAAFVTLVASSD